MVSASWLEEARILLVDDHAIVRRGLVHVLREAFPRAVLAEAGALAQARASLHGQRWDLVLLDINLPDGNGLDLLEALRGDGRGIPALILSSYPEAEFAMAALKAGAAGYLAKGSLLDEVVAAVTRILAGGRYVSSTLGELLAAELGNLPAPPPHATLSPRELEVLKLVAGGHSIKAIASATALSEKTIGTYRSRLGRKLGQASNVDLARYAMKHKLIDDL